MVQTISDSLIKYGKVKRGYLGVNIQDITPEIARNLKLDENFMGVIIADLASGGPAERFGLEQGDIVIMFDSKPIESSAQLRNMVAVTGSRKLVEIRVQRGDEELGIRVRIGDLERSKKLGMARKTEDPSGLAVEKATPEIAKKIGIRKVTGIFVT